MDLTSAPVSSLFLFKVWLFLINRSFFMKEELFILRLGNAGFYEEF